MGRVAVVSARCCRALRESAGRLSSASHGSMARGAATCLDRLAGAPPLSAGSTYTLTFYSHYIDFEKWSVANIPGVVPPIRLPGAVGRGAGEGGRA